MCFYSNAFHAIVLHVCEYVYFQRTPSRRGSRYNASSRIILELNLIKVTMFVMSDDLFRYLFHWNYACSDLYYFLLVHYICLAIMTPERGLIYITELLPQGPECQLLFVLWCYIYVISCMYFYAMKSLGLSVEEELMTSSLLPVWPVSCDVCFYSMTLFL